MLTTVSHGPTRAADDRAPGPKGKLEQVNPLPSCISPHQVLASKPRVFKEVEPITKKFKQKTTNTTLVITNL